VVVPGRRAPVLSDLAVREPAGEVERELVGDPHRKRLVAPAKVIEAIGSRPVGL
jgi:hypothetical protein